MLLVNWPQRITLTIILRGAIEAAMASKFPIVCLGYFWIRFLIGLPLTDESLVTLAGQH